MYRAKRQGGARHEIFDEAMRDRAHARQRIVAALRHAVADDELTFVYQPIVSLVDHRPAAVEALLRWDSPALGRVDPAVFIPIAEHSGLMVDIGAWVLERAMTQAAGWPAGEHQPGPALSVNLSAHQITGPAQVAAVERVLARTGLAPGRLWLELAVVGGDRVGGQVGEGGWAAELVAQGVGEAGRSPHTACALTRAPPGRRSARRLARWAVARPAETCLRVT